MEEKILNVDTIKGRTHLTPRHQMVNNWIFEDYETDEACLLHFAAKLAERSNLTTNDMFYIFPAILRILKNKSKWAK